MLGVICYFTRLAFTCVIDTNALDYDEGHVLQGRVARSCCKVVLQGRVTIGYDTRNSRWETTCRRKSILV